MRSAENTKYVEVNQVSTLENAVSALRDSEVCQTTWPLAVRFCSCENGVMWSEWVCLIGTKRIKTGVAAVKDDLV